MSDHSQGFRSPVLFSSDTRLYTIDTPLGAEAMTVERFVGREALSSLYAYQIDCLSTDAHVELKRLLGQPATLRVRVADGSLDRRSGVVSAVAQLGADGGLARYRLTLAPWLALATLQRRSRVFQDVGVLDIVREVLAAYRPHHHWRVTPDAESQLASLRPRSYCCQYRESDYDFLCRLLAEEGIGFYFEEAEEDSNSVARQCLVLFADSIAFAEDPAAREGIRFHRSAATETQDSIQSFHAHRQLPTASTAIASWDYKTKRVTAAALPTAHDFGGANAPRLESYDWSGLYACATQDEAEHYARLLREADEARSKTWHGTGTVRRLRAGTAFTLVDSPLDQVPGPGGDARRRFALLDVQHAGINNLAPGLTETLGTPDDDFAEPAGDWADLLAAAKATGYANRFAALRADVRWRPALHDGTGARLNPRPTAFGTQTAIVVGADGTTADAGRVHTDHLGRIRIRFHWQTEEHHTCWVRVAQRYAGPGYGAQFIPRIGQEVLVRFFDHDIDRPFVASVLYNGQGEDEAEAFARAGDHAPAGQGNRIGNGAAPAWHGAAGAHGHGAFLSGFKSVALGADGHARQANELVFDDSTGCLRTRLATDTASTQLNLGHLIHQADNYRGSFRGTGWELRTDGHGALRAGKGMLVSTYGGNQLAPAGENSAGIALLQQVKSFADAFHRAAATHQTVQFILVKGHRHNGEAAHSRIDDDKAPIDAMLKVLSGLVDAQDGSVGGQGDKVPHLHAPLVVVTAQAGIGVAASDGMHVAAGEALHLGSGRDTHLAAGTTLSVHSGQAIGVLAGATEAGDGNTGIKLYAGQGDIDLQAQTDALQLAAREQVKLASAAGHIDFAAARAIVMCTEGGASLTIEGGNITFACPGTLSIKASDKSFSGPTSVSQPLPKFPKSICKKCRRNAAASGAPFSMVEE